MDSYGLSDLVSGFTAAEKDRKIKFKEEDTSVLVEEIRKGLCSLAFAYDLGLDGSFVKIPYEGGARSWP